VTLGQVELPGMAVPRAKPPPAPDDDPHFLAAVQARLLVGDAAAAVASLAPGCVQTTITSPPYYSLKDYGDPAQIGLERVFDCLGWARGASPCSDCYVCRLRVVFAAVAYATRKDGTLWLNLGDSWHNVRTHNGGVAPGHAFHGRRPMGTPQSFNPKRALRQPGLKEKDLMGVPWRVALALQADGWTLRADIIWRKDRTQPDKLRDRPHPQHEYLFLFSRRASYRYYPEASPLGAASVWDLPPGPPAPGHHAAYPLELADACLQLSTQPGDLVLDPFCGTGTTVVAAVRRGRSAVGVELVPRTARRAACAAAAEASLFCPVGVTTEAA
jgi:site-specific DNA-methyltransferase (cytosine-N4-specific)